MATEGTSESGAGAWLEVGRGARVRSARTGWWRAPMPGHAEKLQRELRSGPSKPRHASCVPVVESALKSLSRHSQLCFPARPFCPFAASSNRAEAGEWHQMEALRQFAPLTPLLFLPFAEQWRSAVTHSEEVIPGPAFRFDPACSPGACFSASPGVALCPWGGGHQVERRARFERHSLGETQSVCLSSGASTPVHTLTNI